jgi:hypothetical protein
MTMNDAAPKTRDWNLPQESRDRLTYAFGHLVASFGTDAHSGDSGELAADTLIELLGDNDEAYMIIGALGVVAEHVAGNYEWTGEAEDERRKIEAGEL